MKSLFVMDPLDRIQVSGDSTYVTMRECTDRGYPCWYCTPDDLYAVDGQAWARATPVRTTVDAPWFHVGDSKDLCLDDVDVISLCFELRLESTEASSSSFDIGNALGE